MLCNSGLKILLTVQALTAQYANILVFLQYFLDQFVINQWFYLVIAFSAVLLAQLSAFLLKYGGQIIYVCYQLIHIRIKLSYQARYLDWIHWFVTLDIGNKLARVVDVQLAIKRFYFFAQIR